MKKFHIANELFVWNNVHVICKCIKNCPETAMMCSNRKYIAAQRRGCNCCITSALSNDSGIIPSQPPPCMWQIFMAFSWHSPRKRGPAIIRGEASISLRYFARCLFLLRRSVLAPHDQQNGRVSFWLRTANVPNPWLIVIGC